MGYFTSSFSLRFTFSTHTILERLKWYWYHIKIFDLLTSTDRALFCLYIYGGLIYKCIYMKAHANEQIPISHHSLHVLVLFLRSIGNAVFTNVFTLYIFLTTRFLRRRG
jgi:hypothetical protein